MLIDMHAHTSGISPCCLIDYKEVINTAKEKGINGIVLTNHYDKFYIGGMNLSQFAEKYIDEYRITAEYGKDKNFKVFWGIEVTMELYPAVHMLIYGVNFDFLRKNPGLYDMTQKELYELVKSENGILIQAHPYRNGATVLDINYLDGIEINCHPKYGNSYSEKLKKIAEQNNLILTCGGDYHADTYRPICGMYIPENICYYAELSEYIKSHKAKLCIQEPGSDEITYYNIK